MHTTPAIEAVDELRLFPFTSFSNSDDSSPIDAIWYTPLAQCANWFSSPQDWSDLKALVESESNSAKNHIFRTFFRKGKDFNGKLTSDLLRDDNFTLARAAFRKTLVAKPTPYDMEVAHGFLQLLFMDRLLYFQNHRNDRLIRPPISVSLGPISQPDKQTEPFVEICLAWSKQIDDFIDDWDSHFMKTGTISRASGDTGIVASLHNGLKRSLVVSKMAKVEGNFCLAVLAMRALLIVSNLYLSMSTSFSFDV